MTYLRPHNKALYFLRYYNDNFDDDDDEDDNPVQFKILITITLITANHDNRTGRSLI
jgi:hypothetical protein